MGKVVRAFLSPFKLLMLVTAVLFVGVISGQINVLPKHVSAATDCLPNSDAIGCNIVTECDGDCPVQDKDLCRNLEGIQATVPDGYQVNSDGFCEPIQQGQVLSDSTTTPSDPAPQPQVLGASTLDPNK